MSSLLVAIDWGALLLVAVVSIAATVVIAALMSVSNWLFASAEEGGQAMAARRTMGFVVLGVIVAVVLFGLYLMIPYFH